ncbi:hypothetical protein H6P81_016496 [Aristolochia fimbriata]|uniref:Signal peptidase complex subunit 2 n=1 Tax=Aristolochia fimbriata TaxID=158543 RepID=A0AAV7EBJ1_ARIFI|nr:hypothetical protein H6P81_016496 [Aristolochia fimbriata]
MAASNSGSTKSNPKKANLLDPHSIKHILDESVTEIVTARRYKEDVRMSNIRLLLGTIIIVVALVAQFYDKKFPENINFLIGCILLYPLTPLHALWHLITYKKEKNAILITYPIEGSFSTGLVISSKLSRFSDMYTLTVASADPKSIAANEPVHLTKSVTKWFTRDGVLVEGAVLELEDRVRGNALRGNALLSMLRKNSNQPLVTWLRESSLAR